LYINQLILKKQEQIVREM